MHADRPSQTAQHNALFRALEQRLKNPLFTDPLARRFLSGRYRLASLLPAALVARAIDARWPGPRAAVSVRTRWIDDAVTASLASGLDQIVLLGAGFDTRAYRLAGIDRVQVFEVDHPATQAMKRRMVGEAPPHVHYVPLDFRSDSLADALGRAKLRRDARTLWIWEGVTNYLDETSVDATLRFVASAGQRLLFTYVDRAVLDNPAAFQGGRESVAHVARLSEPFTFGLDPAALREYLDARGLELEQDLPLSQAARQYYPQGCPPVSAYYHVVSAACRA
ncbi:MAG TPA: SAM-dependent methyltransferase [Candidatus Limnocylindrales bacterium]|nr:SAM-dependent methyltransferase [Candidatus Limnocylindrales bacterium]